ncbi:hypothetical protein ABG768_013799 [Culter alburnus]|uniref:Uncharacterized protein n=1 Tax=Culter alburnus TaxID=194366 RepID=A0AAW1Z3Q2_CULAL
MTETHSEPTQDAAPTDALNAADAPEEKQENSGCKLSESEDKALVEFKPQEGGWRWVVMLASMWCNGSVIGIQNAVNLTNEPGYSQGCHTVLLVTKSLSA